MNRTITPATHSKRNKSKHVVNLVGGNEFIGLACNDANGHTTKFTTSLFCLVMICVWVVMDTETLIHKHYTVNMTSMFYVM